MTAETQIRSIDGEFAVVFIVNGEVTRQVECPDLEVAESVMRLLSGVVSDLGFSEPDETPAVVNKEMWN